MILHHILSNNSYNSRLRNEGTFVVSVTMQSTFRLYSIAEMSVIKNREISIDISERSDETTIISFHKIIPGSTI